LEFFVALVPSFAQRFPLFKIFGCGRVGKPETFQGGVRERESRFRLVQLLDDLIAGYFSNGAHA